MPMDVDKAAPSANAGGAGAPGFETDENRIAAIVRIAGVEPISGGDEMNVTMAMRRAGAVILCEYQGEVESETLAERVYWVMQTVRLWETRMPYSE